MSEGTGFRTVDGTTYFEALGEELDEWVEVEHREGDKHLRLGNMDDCFFVDRTAAAKLYPVLKQFAETGEIGERKI